MEFTFFIAPVVLVADEPAGHTVQCQSKDAGIIDKVVGKTDKAVSFVAQLLQYIRSQYKADPGIDHKGCQAGNQVDGGLFIVGQGLHRVSPPVSVAALRGR